MAKSRCAMTESLDTHQAPAVRQPPASRQALSAFGVDVCPRAVFAGQTVRQRSSFTVYTHKLHAPCLLAADLGLLQPVTSVYTYKQTRFCLPMAARRLQAQRLSDTDSTQQRLPIAMAVFSSLGMARSVPAVYTYKQGQPSAPPPGQRRPPHRVYTHKHQHTNPAQSGVRCVWDLKTGEQP